MFEDISYTLQQCGCFFVFGAVMGLCYEPLRLLRMMFKHNIAAVFIEDLLFFSLSGFACFITALWVGIGYFRIYYIVFAFLGVCCYFLTLGMLLNKILKKTVKIIKAFFCAIYKKIKPIFVGFFSTIYQIIKPLFVNIADFFHNKLLKPKKGLPNTDEMVYNNKNTFEDGGESGSVIKAQIRKKA